MAKATDFVKMVNEGGKVEVTPEHFKNAKGRAIDVLKEEYKEMEESGEFTDTELRAFELVISALKRL